MLAQEFELLNVIKVWDTFIADNQKWNFVYYVSVAQVQIRRAELLRGDFSDIMEILQKKNKLEVNENEYMDKLIDHAK